MDEDLKITLNSITQIKDNIIRINAFDIKAVLHVIPQANNCIEIKVTQYKEE